MQIRRSDPPVRWRGGSCRFPSQGSFEVVPSAPHRKISLCCDGGAMILILEIKSQVWRQTDSLLFSSIALHFPSSWKPFIRDNLIEPSYPELNFAWNASGSGRGVPGNKSHRFSLCMAYPISKPGYKWKTIFKYNSSQRFAKDSNDFLVRGEV